MTTPAMLPGYMTTTLLRWQNRVLYCKSWIQTGTRPSDGAGGATGYDGDGGHSDLPDRAYDEVVREIDMERALSRIAPFLCVGAQFVRSQARKAHEADALNWRMAGWSGRLSLYMAIKFPNEFSDWLESHPPCYRCREAQETCPHALDALIESAAESLAKEIS